MEDVSAYSDDQVGAAVREPHDQCRDALARYFKLMPVIDGVEGTYAKAPAFLERTGMYGAYGELTADLFRDVFSLDTTPRRHLLAVARAALRRSPVSVRQLVSDGWAGMRAL